MERHWRVAFSAGIKCTSPYIITALLTPTLKTNMAATMEQGEAVLNRGKKRVKQPDNWERSKKRAKMKAGKI